MTIPTAYYGLPWDEWLPFTHVFSAPGMPFLSPYGFSMIEIRRAGWPKPVVVNPAELPPEFNVYGLEWRPWPAEHPKFDGP